MNTFKTFENAFKSIIEDIALNGKITSSRIGNCKEILSYNYRVEDLSSYQFENESVGRLSYDYASTFYEWMVSGSTDNKALLEKYPNVAKFVEKPKSELLPENFNTFYGPRIKQQLPKIIKELSEKPDSRRAAILILDSEDLELLDKDESLEFPCTTAATFSIREDRLNVHLHMRSQNMGQVAKLDMYLWGRFTNELSKTLGVGLGNFDCSIVSAHIFERDFDYFESIGLNIK